MAFRALILMMACAILFALGANQSQACFGPKLFVAVGQEARDEVAYALVSLYVEEKTGVESTRFDGEPGQGPLDLVSADKVDLAFADVPREGDNIVFRVTGLPALVTGKRPVEDLQFTTVLPAITKLNVLLESTDTDVLIKRVQAGESALAVVREFFMKNRLI